MFVLRNASRATAGRRGRRRLGDGTVNATAGTPPELGRAHRHAPHLPRRAGRRGTALVYGGARRAVPMEGRSPPTVGTGVEVALAVVVITWLRWWPPVLHERLCVRPWLWALPFVMLAAPIALTDYAQSRASGWGLVLGLALGCLLIGAGEELLFRGVALTFTRARYREWIAALVATALFAAFHLPGGVLVAVGAGLTGAAAVRRPAGVRGHHPADRRPRRLGLRRLQRLPRTRPGLLRPRPARSLPALLGLVIVIAVTHRWWRDRMDPCGAQTTAKDDRDRPASHEAGGARLCEGVCAPRTGGAFRMDPKGPQSVVVRSTAGGAASWALP